jgi:hypothetical protein
VPLLLPHGLLESIWALITSEVQLLPAPHRPPTVLPAGQQAVYCFLLGNGCLKVGKAGAKTQARFTSQHYGGHAPSTLAESIIKNRSCMRALVAEAGYREIEALDIHSVGAWLEKNAARLHLLLPAGAPARALNFAEAFLRCWLRPVYEGKAT